LQVFGGFPEPFSLRIYHFGAPSTRAVKKEAKRYHMDWIDKVRLVCGDEYLRSPFLAGCMVTEFLCECLKKLVI